MAKQFKPETLCVQAGWTPKKGIRTALVSHSTITIVSSYILCI